jgi:hypothetical protein
METNITQIDEMEAKVEFSGYIFISAKDKHDFDRDLYELINRYAI